MQCNFADGLFASCLEIEAGGEIEECTNGSEKGEPDRSRAIRRAK